MAGIIDYFDLNDKVAVVTGGYGHLGSAITRVLLECNAVVIVAGRSMEKFIETFNEIRNPNLHFEEIDILSSKSIEECISTVVSKYGSIDILVNNAHASRGGGQLDLSDDDWNYSMEGVVGSVHKSIRAVVPYMKEQKSGKIINVTSMYGIVSPDFSMYKGDDCEKYTNPPQYGAAKAAMIQLTKYYAVLLGKNNIFVNAIAPGPFPKRWIQEVNPKFTERLANKNPLNKIGQPKDLAGTIALLSSQASDFITGQTIQIDGGWTLW